MNDSLVVGRSKAVGDLKGIVHGLVPGKCAVLESGAERLSFEKLHHRKGDVRSPSEIVNRENVGMRERCHGLGFPLEAGEGPLDPPQDAWAEP